ncbi:arsenate reductase [Balneicella halophila]|uniref:Arsenate reductase n=1 Tax=Balneicella halophila TaxID=1537566 RepID=A0A7L4UNB7_BALHA|nr:arsenate reductase family protein [Balneicella halophila]PVX49828.1 arsenate reductase [Balneicella halophila]
MTKLLLVQYPNCSTCRKASKWLADDNIDIESRHIVEDTPTKDELAEWINRSELPVKKFFNTSGKVYREMNLKDKVKTASEEELIKLLASDGMLIKRPIVVADDFVLVGFKEEEWKEKLLK